MSDKLISQYEEDIPQSVDFVLFDKGDGFYKKSQVGNLGVSGGGGSASTLSTPSLSVSVISATQINLSWTNVSNESSYQLQRSTNGLSWTTIATPSVDNTSYNDTGLTASTLYYYRVKAVGNGSTFLDSGYGSGSGTTSSTSSTPLSTPLSFAATVISSTQINLTWGDVANEDSYQLEWSPNGSSGWTQIGGTIAAGATSYNHTGLTGSTAYYYRLRAIGSGIYSNSAYATTNATTSAAGPSLEALTFPTVTGSLTNTSGVWTSGAGSWDTNRGLSGKKLASGQNGYIQFQYDASDGQNSMLAFNLSNANDIYTSYEVGIWLSGGTGYFIDNGTIGGLGAATVGDWFRINRVGSTITIQSSSNSGSSWTTLRSCSFSSTADLFINININGDSTGKMYYPKGFNLTNA